MDIAPGVGAAQVLLQLPVSIVNSAAQGELIGTFFQPVGRKLCEQGQGIVGELAPADRIQFAEQTDHFRLPGPPQVAGKHLHAVIEAEMVGVRATQGSPFDHAGVAIPGCQPRVVEGTCSGRGILGCFGSSSWRRPQRNSSHHRRRLRDGPCTSNFRAGEKAIEV